LKNTVWVPKLVIQNWLFNWAHWRAKSSCYMKTATKMWLPNKNSRFPPITE
jgi:hypothetical protein